MPKHSYNLTFYSTVTIFQSNQIRGSWKICGKRRKCWFPSFSPFSTIFFNIIKAKSKHLSNNEFVICNWFPDKSNCFFSFDKVLTLNHTISTFDDLEKEVFWKHCWKRRKILVIRIFPYSHNVFYPFQTKFQFFSHFYFVVCKCFQSGPVLNFVIR